MSEENKQPMEEQEEAIPETQAGPEQEAPQTEETEKTEKKPAKAEPKAETKA